MKWFISLYIVSCNSVYDLCFPPERQLFYSSSSYSCAALEILHIHIANEWMGSFSFARFNILCLPFHMYMNCFFHSLFAALRLEYVCSECLWNVVRISIPFFVLRFLSRFHWCDWKMKAMGNQNSSTLCTPLSLREMEKN